MLGVFVSGKRFNLVIYVITATFAVILGRLFYLQVLKADELRQLAENTRKDVERIPARRGNILDAEGNILAVTQSVMTVGMDPQMLRPEDISRIPHLAHILGIDPEVVEAGYKEKLSPQEKLEGKQGKRWIKLAESVDERTYKRIKALRMRGIYGNRTYERKYPAGSSAAHVLGFINKEGQAVSGVEHEMDFYLRGQEGWRESERDGRRRELAQFRKREVKAKDGMHIELSIDAVIQHIIEEELEDIVEQYKPESATIIVSDAKTGFILGLANTPSFDPNMFWEYELDTMRNRAVTDIFEPGSSFKIITAGAVLNEGIVDLEDTFDCSLTEAPYHGRMVPLPKDVSRNGVLSLRDVVTKSSNRGIAQAAMKLGGDKLYKYAKAFGYGEKTGYGFDGESLGILHPPKLWDGLTISRMPMGHAVAGTPMQVHYAFGVLASEGILMQPQVVKRIVDDAGQTVIDFKPHARRRVLPPEIVHEMRILLNRAVQPNGISRRAVVPGYTAAGKSGTTQKIVGNAYSTDYHVASFVGFLPAEEPQIVISVVVDGPKMKGVAFGGLVAAPVFSNVAKEVVQYLGIAPTGENSQNKKRSS